MNSRPKFNETEEDILKQQAEFIKNKFTPSVKVISDTKVKNEAEIENKVNTVNSVCIENSFLVKNIIERNVNAECPMEMNPSARFSTGFPQAKRRQITSISYKKGSIFSQSKKFRTDQNIEKIEENSPTASNFKNKNLPPRSFIIQGKESGEIHEENLKTLHKMSEKEILEEQNKLLSSLDPDIIKFLKSKRKNNEFEISNDTEMIMDKENTVNIEQLETPKEIIDNSSEKWLNFDKIEVEKFQWMKNIEIPKNPENNEPFEARFDFSGWLLPYTELEISEKNRVLYHHGEEPGRPGYSLKELFKLSRSNVQQQRILSLNTIANILSLNSTGLYDGILEIPIEQIFFVIRICLDHNTPSVLNASIKAMHHLFYNQIDETCLDSLIGFGLGLQQPMITSDKVNTSKDEDKEINDQQMAEIDLIKCLARTEILTRIRYIINTVKPTTETINYCLELLIRLIRDSDEIMMQVYNCEDLISSVIKHFVPKVYKLDNISDRCYGTPLMSAIKLLRIFSCRNKNIAEDLINRHSIMDPLLSYIGNENITRTTYGVKLQIETLNLLSVFFEYQLGVNSFSLIEQFLIHSLDYHLKNLNINEKTSYNLQNHFSSLINVISLIASVNYNYINNFIPLITQCIGKYSTQVSNLKEFQCGKLQIISSLLIAINAIRSSTLNYDYVDQLIGNLCNSIGFSKITEDIKCGSNLLCTYEPHKIGSNLNTLEASIWNTSEHIVPCLQTKSCIPFLTALSYYIEFSNEKIILLFLQHPNILKYLNYIKNCLKFNLTANWFTRLESQFIINILKSVIKVQNSVKNPELFYNLSVKCLSIFNAEQKQDINEILKNIVFNKTFYPNELLMDNLNINDNKEVITHSLDFIQEIYELYAETLGLKKNSQMTSTLTVDNQIGNIIPIDWIYSPIVAFYVKHQESEQSMDENLQIKIITRCLQWIFLYETYFPELSSYINATDRFCRLSCIFLCSNTLFLENNIHKLLELCLKSILKPDVFKTLNFDKEIQGLSNFQDFYTELLEQYQGVSYSNHLFANFILIPLIQRQNVKFRKVLWSEYLGVAQTITLNHEQCLINVEELLNPPENELSLLKCYRRALVSNQLNRCPLLQFIANFHVENFVKNKLF